MRTFRTIATFLSTLLVAGIAHAQNASGFVPLANDPKATMLNAVYNSTSLGQYVNTLFKISLSVGAILAVMRIAYAGYLYMGNDMWGKKQQAKEILGDVTLGLLLLLSIFLILNQINPQLLQLDVLKTPAAQSVQTGTTN